MARPKKHDDEKRGASLPTIRVTTAERNHIEDMAALTGQSLSDFVRDCALFAEIKSQKKPHSVAVFSKVKSAKQPENASLLVELNRIGVNLNQIAHAANVGRTNEHLLQSAINDLSQMMQKLDEAL